MLLRTILNPISVHHPPLSRDSQSSTAHHTGVATDCCHRRGAFLFSNKKHKNRRLSYTGIIACLYCIDTAWYMGLLWICRLRSMLVRLCGRFCFVYYISTIIHGIDNNHTVIALHRQVCYISQINGQINLRIFQIFLVCLVSVDIFVALFIKSASGTLCNG